MMVSTPAMVRSAGPPESPWQSLLALSPTVMVAAAMALSVDVVMLRTPAVMALVSLPWVTP